MSQYAGLIRVALLILGIAHTIAQSSTFVLAIVRPDGYLVPFVAYANGQWERAWPAADEKISNDPTFENTPSFWRRHGQSVPRTWHLWSLSATKPTQVHVSGIQSVETHCEAQVALKTNLTPVRTKQPGKRGVAVDEGVRLAAIEQVDESDGVWKVAERAVGSSLSELERRAQADRVQLPSETPTPTVRITALYRESHSARSPMYFVAEKAYRTARMPHDSQCRAVTIMTGWLIPAENDGLAIRTPRIFLTDCDGKEVLTGEPLAALHWLGRRFWILEERGYEGERYTVAEITRSGVQNRLSVHGGGC